MAIDLVKIFGALAVFFVGLWQYRKAQRWKRREFIAAEVNNFQRDLKNRLVMIFLDWSDRKLLFPSFGDKEPVLIEVTSILLCESLLPHGNSVGFGPEAVIVRDCIDNFLEGLVRFENFVTADLISIEELENYLEYWIKLLSGNMPGRHSCYVFILLLNYIRVYDFAAVSRLIERFGYTSLPDKREIDKAIKFTNKGHSQVPFTDSSIDKPRET